jgi:hypothetical protein
MLTIFSETKLGGGLVANFFVAKNAEILGIEFDPSLIVRPMEPNELIEKGYIQKDLARDVFIAAYDNYIA